MKVYFTTHLSKMPHYETRAGTSPCILEFFQIEYRLQIAHCDFVHRLYVPSQMQPTTFEPFTLDLKKKIQVRTSVGSKCSNNSTLVFGLHSSCSIRPYCHTSFLVFARICFV
jgi:hypothetical protein